jgi:hypothetical protein
MEQDQSKNAWEIPAPDHARHSRVEDGAGIYLCDGRTHFVGRRSSAEAMLIERGALLVATVRVEATRRERGAPAPVEQVEPRALARRFSRPHPN